MFKSSNRIRSIFIILFLVFLSFFAISPLFHKGFFVTDDGEWMIIRFSAFYQALHDGQFPVRLLSRLNFGYGYPVSTFLYPGFMYFAIPLQIVKLGFVLSIKIILGFSLIGSTVFVYLWLSKLFSKAAGLVGALVSLYLPYHLYDVYKRGSVGEVFALVWVAFILWMIERKSVFFVSLGIFFLLIAHNTLGILFLPVIFIYAWIRNFFPKKDLFISFGLGIFLSSFFIIPIISEIGYTQFIHTQVSNPLEYFADISLIGISTLLLVLLSIFFFIKKQRKLKQYKYIIWLFLFVSIVSLFLSSSYSSFAWHNAATAFVQFPFRLLSYLVISAAFLSAFLIEQSKGKAKIILVVIILVGISFSAVSFLGPKAYFDKGEGYYFTNDATTTVKDEYMPVWVKQKPLNRPGNKLEIIKGKGEVQDVLYTNTKISSKIIVEKDAIVRINTIYWPGWKVFVDGKIVPISYNNQIGLIEFNISQGSHAIEARFTETPSRLFADTVSLLSFITLILVCLPKGKREKKK